MTYTPEQQAIIDIFDEHVQAEITGDLDRTLETMSVNPHIIIAANRMGGNGPDAVRAFYQDSLIGQFFAPDTEVTDLTYTVADGRIVIEQILQFSHSQRMDWMLPGVEPTGKRVKIALVVIVGTADGKVSYEHIYWNQASVLVQVGLLDPALLPVTDGREVDLLLDPSSADFRTT